MKKTVTTAVAAIFCLVCSCSVEPDKIEYGTDVCSFCKMTIVDRQHASQYVTAKGKQFKFDAIECMVNDLADKDRSEIGLLLIADYQHPGTMTAANAATYLITEEIKSPMGANLSGFASADEASEVHRIHGGQLLKWEELLDKFDVE